MTGLKEEQLLGTGNWELRTDLWHGQQKKARS
jgi:hypothetical protein